ncbi:PD-(D/E)XK nuclease family protein [Corynebacterium terpenotabidum]|uniref:PD-(D/E)XK endonuclease-like domain-containing protein n=1 Tax=Corynebacterium terpenotabidum Y-11 TaxID=1200352 RepID=S4XBA1_9CORY|nr:PD-(D/E)XK nuclease family protein [Corynebacterium terpenotabidum]AGP30392.1 hypothetical protein A606_03705 [Corynebacterium terpenotabidum Y-11]
MHITFGWGFDTARWTTATRPATLREVVTGPAGLTEILATRLALTQPGLDRPTRIAAYRSALLQTVSSLPEDAWPVQSTTKDPWTVARDLLSWRDELVTAGWAGADHDPSTGNHSHTRCTDGHDGSDDTPARLSVLARIEALLPLQTGWAPGPADLLHDVDITLTDLASSGIIWPLGIDVLSLDHRREDLPPVWQRILSALDKLGVLVTEMPAPAPLTDLTFLTADTEWDAAPAIARRLTDLDRSATPHTVVAGRSTELVDLELTRIGGTPIGVRPASVAPLADIIPVYLRAMMEPHDVHALVDLLNIRVPGMVFRGKDVPLCEEHGEEGYSDGHQDCEVCAEYWKAPARYEATDHPLIWGALHHTLVDALNKEPGIGGPAWIDAVEQALAWSDDNDLETMSIHEFDRLIRQEPLNETEEGLSTAAIGDHLEWLVLQLLTATAGSVADRIVNQIHQITDLIDGFGDRITSRDLDHVITAVTDSRGLRVHAEASPSRDVVTDPAHLGTGNAPVFWWLPVDDAPTLHDRLRPSESAWLTSTGVELPDREKLALLVLDSQLRALRRRGSVTVILPTQVDGEDPSEHPALTFLRDDVRRTGGTVPVEDAVLPDGQHTTASAIDLRAPEPFYREFTPNEDLLPTRISFSQWKTLLIHPMEWLMNYRLGIEPAGLADLPTGNRMIGTWLHAVVEQIVNSRLADTDGEPALITVSPEEVRDTLTALLPWYASELQLPGRQRELGATLDLAVRSITRLFGILGASDIRVSGVESQIDPEQFSVPGTRGADDRPLGLRGSRDMDVVLADGTRGVIDLKYTNRDVTYHDKILHGTALQLAVYAASVAAETGSEDLSDVPVGYFTLNSGRLYTADPRFRLDPSDTIAVDPGLSTNEVGSTSIDDLWDRSVAQLNHVLDELRAGRVTDLGNLLETDAWEQDEDDAVTARYRADLLHARTTGFLPEDEAQWTSFPQITGLNGDFA